ncbi:MAG: hypothetical protein H0T14_06175, partial [Nocardioidaceae bacterium]|nr:hypothetical protein [Nocardioidaceae bacterium]
TDTPSGSPDDYPVVDSVERAGDRADFSFDRPITTRFLLVWLTSLPSEGLASYRGRVSDIQVLG